MSDIMPIVMAKDNKKQKVLYQYMGNVFLESSHNYTG